MSKTTLTEFLWPHGAESVQVTGDGDNWASRHDLAWSASTLQWTASVPLPEKTKVHFKFVINGGEWKTRDDQPTEWDSNGNMNNFLVTEAAPVEAAAPVAGQPAAAQAETGSGEQKKDIKTEGELIHTHTSK